MKPTDKPENPPVIDVIKKALSTNLGKDVQQRMEKYEKALLFYSNPADWHLCEAGSSIGKHIREGDPMMVFEPGEDSPWRAAKEALKKEGV